MSTRAQTRSHALRSQRAVPRPRYPEGGGWDVRASPTGAVVTTAGRPLAEGRVEDAGDRVVVQFWTSSGLPQQLRVRLAAVTFRHPALRPRRSVLVCMPAGEAEVLTEARSHLTGSHSHLAGATCLLEGVVESGLLTDEAARRTRAAAPAVTAVDRSFCW